MTAVVAMAAVVAFDRPRLRAAEDAYVDGRAVTACATRRLGPFASEQADLDELPAALDEILAEARADAERVHRRAMSLPMGIHPSVRDAGRAVRHALEAETALYEAMVEDPTGSEDELEELGRANARAERELADARRWMLADEPDGWEERFRCPAVRSAQASSSSSK